MKDLTISNIERQNVLNNRFAVGKIQEHLDIEGMLFEGEYRFTKYCLSNSAGGNISSSSFGNLHWSKLQSKSINCWAVNTRLFSPTSSLTISNIERQNVLNNRFAVGKIQEHLDIEGMLFEGEYRFTKKMVADFYQVDTSTIDRYLQSNSEELKHNGYILCKGKQLKEFKLEFAHLINEVSKTTQLGLFNFRSFLNIGMLLTDSEKAKKVRSLILDFVITTINEKTGGGTKYINRRDVHYLPAAITEENYRKNRQPFFL